MSSYLPWMSQATCDDIHHLCSSELLAGLGITWSASMTVGLVRTTISLFN